MEWNVYYYDINKKEIGTYNIFEHGSFKQEFDTLVRLDTSKEEFADELKRILMYYFCSKCEWKTVLKPWVGDMNIGKKIDVYEQIEINWDKFMDYCWKERSNLRRYERIYKKFNAK